MIEFQVHHHDRLSSSSGTVSNYTLKTFSWYYQQRTTKPMFKGRSKNCIWWTVIRSPGAVSSSCTHTAIRLASLGPAPGLLLHGRLQNARYLTAATCIILWQERSWYVIQHCTRKAERNDEHPQSRGLVSGSWLKHESCNTGLQFWFVQHNRPVKQKCYQMVAVVVTPAQ